MKNIEILFLTNNQHKINEYNNILPHNFNLNTLKDLELDPKYVEDGKTFEENAKIKLDSLPVERLNNIDYIISEDSGLCIESLSGEPGIYSARYSGHGSEENNKLVIDKLKDEQNRQAYFVAVIGLKNIKTKEIKYFYGKMNGTIANEISYEGEGFAYDFIFIPKHYDKTIAKLGSEVKNKLSHRYKAIEKLIEELNRK